MEPLMSSDSCVCNDDPSLAANNQDMDSDKSWMIECDVCHVWFHGGCVRLTPTSAATVDKFHCPRCEPLCGPSLVRASTNAHRHDQTDPNAASKATQVGTEVFIEELKRRQFASARLIVRYVEGDRLTPEYFAENEFKTPVVVKHPEGLDIRRPQLSLSEIVSLVGADATVDVIDVRKQEGMPMKLGDFVTAFSASDDGRVLNCLSLEITGTPLGTLVDAPRVIRDLCWVRNYWPDNLDYEQPEAPKVSKYCIMSRAKSFTDFHIDFSGSSVWYHIISGSKVFYLIPPSTRNLAIFERWNRLSAQSETFFADMIGGECCYKLELCEGETLFLPAGIIHAVYTPEDSIVLGGNFLHSFDIQMQLKLRDMEEKMRFPVKFKFPDYEAVNWFASKHLLQSLKSYSTAHAPCPQYLLSGCKSLLKALKSWTEVPPPASINSHRVVRELSKVIRNLEKRSKQSKKKVEKPEVEVQQQLPPMPIKLMLPKPLPPKANFNVNLTDRDSVRQLMLDRKKQSIRQLNDELGSALLSFKSDQDDMNEEEEEERPKLHIDVRLKRPSPKKASSVKSDYFIPKMTEVHQDDDFVYPSLDFSDDDDVDDAQLAAKADKDTLWNPKARVKHAGTKRDRLPRENAKRIEVEKGLQLAAERMRNRKKLKRSIKRPEQSGKSKSAISSQIPIINKGLSSVSKATSSAAPSTILATAAAKPKKGMATAKQRLGKKLKLKFC
jgi:hypothetical protein